MPPSGHYSIGEVLSLLQADFPDVTISKIRFLESQGLIDPERTPSGYRRFFEDDLRRLRWILVQQRDHYLPLKVIRDRLEAGEPFVEGPEEPTAPAVASSRGAVGDADDGEDVPGPTSGDQGGVAARAGAGEGPRPSPGDLPSAPTAGSSPPEPAAAPDVSAAQAPLGNRRQRELAGRGEGSSSRSTSRRTTSTTPAAAPAPPTPAPSTPAPSTPVPPTSVPPTSVPPTSVPPTAVPPTAVPPTAVPPTPVPPTAVPPTPRSPTPGSPTATPSTAQPDGSPRDAGAPDAPATADPTGPPAASPSADRTAAGPGEQGELPPSPTGRTAEATVPAPIPQLGSPPGGPPPAEPSHREAPTAVDKQALTRDELAEASGCSVRVLTDLEKYGLVHGRPAGTTVLYEAPALEVARLAARFLDHGLEPRHLRPFRLAAEREIGLFAQVVGPLLQRRDADARERAMATVAELIDMASELHRIVVEQLVDEELRNR